MQGQTLLLEGQLADTNGVHELVHGCLVELPDVIGMQAISAPLVVVHQGNVTGLVIIAESHIAVEVRQPGALFLTVSSCKPFDLARCLGYVVQTFRPNPCRYHVIPWGPDAARGLPGG